MVDKDNIRLSFLGKLVSPDKLENFVLPVFQPTKNSFPIAVWFPSCNWLLSTIKFWVRRVIESSDEGGLNWQEKKREVN